MSQLKPFALIFFVLVMFWIGMILIAGQPRDRIDAACVPIPSIGKFFTSVGSLASPQIEAGVAHFFSQRTYDCRYVLWRQFYEDDYQKMMAAARAQEEALQKAVSAAKTQAVAPAGLSATGAN